jgi:hypothetical protein
MFALKALEKSMVNLDRDLESNRIPGCLPFSQEKPGEFWQAAYVQFAGK